MRPQGRFVADSDPSSPKEAQQRFTDAEIIRRDEM